MKTYVHKPLGCGALFSILLLISTITICISAGLAAAHAPSEVIGGAFVLSPLVLAIVAFVLRTAQVRGQERQERERQRLAHEHYMAEQSRQRAEWEHAQAQRQAAEAQRQAAENAHRAELERAQAQRQAAEAQRQAAERARVEREREESAARRKADLIARFGEGDASRIIHRNIWIGQTAAMLEEARGTPVEVDRKVLKTKQRETWKYEWQGANRYRVRVTVENGIVTGWEEK